MLSKDFWGNIAQKIACAMLAQSTWPSFCMKITNEIFPWSGLANIAQEKYLCNVGPWETDNFYGKNKLYNVGLSSD